MALQDGNDPYGLNQDPRNPPAGMQWDPVSQSFVPIGGAGAVPQIPLQPGQTRDPVTGAVIGAAPAGTPAYDPNGTSNVGLPGVNGLPIQAQTPSDTNNPPAGPSGNGAATNGSLGSLVAPFTGTPPPLPGTGTPYIPPTPVFTPPGYTPPPAFKFDAFKSPTAQDVLSDPGYQFRLGQGEQALQQGAAARGTLNGGATQKAILGYGQDYASNEFNNVYNRDLTSYNTNYQSALGQYNTNYNTQYLDPYNIAYQGAQASFAPQMTGYQTQAAAGQHQSDLSYADAYNQFLNDQNTFYGRQDANFNKAFNVANAG